MLVLDVPSFQAGKGAVFSFEVQAQLVRETKRRTIIKVL